MAKAPAAAKIKTLEDFDKKWKANVVDRARKAGTSGFWKTGSRELDKRLGGGLPQGEIVELYGGSGSGKSTVALNTAKNVLKDPEAGAVAYFDLERGLDFTSEANYVKLKNGEWVVDVNKLPSGEAYEEQRTGWLRKNGIDPFDPRFKVYQVDHGEQMFAMIIDMINSGLFALAIVDSTAAILTRAQMEGEPGEAGFGAVAKLLGVELPRILRTFDNNPESKMTVVMINQIRDKIGYMSNGGTKSFGGRAQEFFVGMKARFTRIKRAQVSGVWVTTTRVLIEKGRKNGVQECQIYINAERGLDTVGELLDVGKAAGLIHVSGNSHFIYDSPLSEQEFDAAKKPATLPGFLIKTVGEGKTLTWLLENGWEARLSELAESVSISDDEAGTLDEQN